MGMCISWLGSAGKVSGEGILTVRTNADENKIANYPVKEGD